MMQLTVSLYHYPTYHVSQLSHWIPFWFQTKSITEKLLFVSAAQFWLFLWKYSCSLTRLWGISALLAPLSQPTQHWLNTSSSPVCPHPLEHQFDKSYIVSLCWLNFVRVCQWKLHLQKECYQHQNKNFIKLLLSWCFNIVKLMLKWCIFFQWTLKGDEIYLFLLLFKTGVDLPFLVALVLPPQTSSA